MQKAKPFFNVCSSVMKIIIATLGVSWAIYIGVAGLDLQKWSARNDSLQSCLALESRSEYCNATIEAGVRPPPVWKRNLLVAIDNGTASVYNILNSTTPASISAAIVLTVSYLIAATLYFRPRMQPFHPVVSLARCGNTYQWLDVLKQVRDNAMAETVACFVLSSVMQGGPGLVNVWQQWVSSPEPASAHNEDGTTPLDTTDIPDCNGGTSTVPSPDGEVLAEGNLFEDERPRGKGKETMVTPDDVEPCDESDEELPVVSLEPEQPTGLKKLGVSSYGGEGRPVQRKEYGLPPVFAALDIEDVYGREPPRVLMSTQQQYLHEKFWRIGDRARPDQGLAAQEDHIQSLLKAASLTSLLGICGCAQGSLGILEELEQSSLFTLRLSPRDVQWFRTQSARLAHRISELPGFAQIHLRKSVWEEIMKRKLHEEDNGVDTTAVQSIVLHSLVDCYALGNPALPAMSFAPPRYTYDDKPWYYLGVRDACDSIKKPDNFLTTIEAADRLFEFEELVPDAADHIMRTSSCPPNRRHSEAALDQARICLRRTHSFPELPQVEVDSGQMTEIFDDFINYRRDTEARAKLEADVNKWLDSSVS